MAGTIWVFAILYMVLYGFSGFVTGCLTDVYVLFTSFYIMAIGCSFMNAFFGMLKVEPDEIQNCRSGLKPFWQKNVCGSCIVDISWAHFGTCCVRVERKY